MPRILNAKGKTLVPPIFTGHANKNCGPITMKIVLGFVTGC